MFSLAPRGTEMDLFTKKKNKDGHKETELAMDTDNDEVFTDTSLSSEDIRTTKGRKGEEDNPFRRRSTLARTPPLRGTYSLMEDKKKDALSDLEVSSKDADASSAASTSGSFDPFKRRDSIGRSPTRAGGKERKDEEGAPEIEKGKRLREDSEEDLKDLKKMFAKLKKAINDLSREVQQNTRVEIKKGIKVAKWQSDEIFRRWDALTLERREKKKSKWMEEQDDDVLIVEEVKTTQKEIKETRTIGIQVSEDVVRKEIGETENETVMKVREQLDRKKGWSGLVPLLDLKWPERTFANASIHRGAGKANTEDDDIAVIVDPKLGVEGKALEKVRDSFPDLEGLLAEGLTGVEYIRKKTQTVSSRGEGIDKTSTLYVLPLETGDIEANTAPVTERFYHRLEEVTALLTESGRDKFKLIPQEGIRLQNMRKCVEAALAGSNIKGEIVIEKKLDGRKEEGQRTKKKSQLQPQGSKVVVKMKGRNYADTLKYVKGKINPANVEVKINRVKRTAKGDLLLEIEGGMEKANRLKTEIEKGKEEGTTVEHVKSTTHIMIWGIEPDSSEEDIVEALVQKVGGSVQGEMRVTSLRPTKGGNLAATVSVSKRVLKDVLRNGTVRIGWSLCRMRERVNIVRCFRCLGFGHLSTECRGENRANHCLNCGEEGHLAKDCSNASFCNSCKKGGHRADQMTCPEFRRLVNKRKEDREIGQSRVTGGQPRPRPTPTPVSN